MVLINSLRGFIAPASILATLLLLLTAFLITRQAQPLQARGADSFTYLPLVLKPEPLVQCTTYQEQNGLVVFEVESTPPIEYWTAETDLAGFTGDSYYTWRGPEYFTTPGVAPLAYQIMINTPGLYYFRLHNRHDYPDPSQQNDLFAQMDNSGWIKTFSSPGGVWTWTTAFDHHTFQGNAEYQLGAGLHTLQLSARSHGFSIDRITLYLPGVANGEDISLPVSPCF
jgi:hypothetical protein